MHTIRYRSLTAHTPRLVIRPVERGDFEAFAAGYRNCLPSRNRFDEGGFDTAFMTPAWFDRLLARRAEEAERDYSYMLNIFRISDGRSVGYCDITPHYRETFQYGRIGYTIHNPYWGMGYATEAVQAMVGLGFGSLGLHRLEAHVNLDNPASERVPCKAGFTFECIRRGFIWEDGAWTDQKIFCRTNEQAGAPQIP